MTKQTINKKKINSLILGPARVIMKVYPKRSYKDIKNYNLLISLKGNFKENLNVTFRLLDGTKKTMPLNNEFFYNKNNELLTEAKIIEKLNTIKHDYLANDYVINKL